MDDLEPGDIFITSMPAFTGSHPADMMLWMPIFHRDRLFGFSASKAHLIDVGAKDPYPTDSTDAFQEGLRIPPVKLYRAGVLDQTLASIIKSNSRAPEVVWGDIHAEIASFRTGEQGVLRLLKKYGFDAVQAFTDDALTTCTKCSGRLRKLFNSVGVVFKGSGFYRTDSRDSGKGSSSIPSGGSESNGSSTSTDKSTSTSSDKSASSSSSSDSSSSSSSSSKAAAAS